MNSIIKAFDTKNLSQIVDFVKPMWSFSEWEDNFRRFYVEIILRNSFFENGLAFQITDNENPKRLCSAMFFQKKSDSNNLQKWLLENSESFSEAQKQSVNLCAEYLEFMDSKVHTLMTQHDIKLSLFVGLKKGFGSVIFGELWNYLKNHGYKNMYLWTDCECNWKWYLKEGFSLIEEIVYEKFNDENGEYKAYIFKKAF
ncbi:MAG: hypothetical protein IJA53_00065 [Spirochaetaceae bacterium]|nr:hypothetical protein [Spirochaetaceae bacterium]